LASAFTAKPRPRAIRRPAAPSRTRTAFDRPARIAYAPLPSFLAAPEPDTVSVPKQPGPRWGQDNRTLATPLELTVPLREIAGRPASTVAVIRAKSLA
jgi:hypothetical protein